MPLKSCVKCGKVGCSRHQRKANAPWSPNRDVAAQMRFRRAVLPRDNFTCQDCGHRDPTGRTLRACHIVPLRSGGGYDPSNGRTRCKACDKATDPYAR